MRVGCGQQHGQHRGQHASLGYQQVRDRSGEYARALVSWRSSPIGRAIVATTILAATLSDAARVPEIGALERGFHDDRLRRAESIVSRAIARGELPSDTDAAEVVKTMIAPTYLRLLITGEPIDAATADRAARAGILRLPPSRRAT